jgi:hypothetical protein
MDEAYRLGYESTGSFYDNPYKDGTDEARRWVDGKVQAIIDVRKERK